MKKSIKLETFSRAVLLIIVSMLALQFLIIFQTTRVYFQKQRNHEISRYVNFVSRALEDSEKLTKDYERILNENIFDRAKALRFELQGKQAIDISTETLQKLKEKYNIFGVAILAQSGREIMILNSTIKEEIGISTESWGYWNDAFRDLFLKVPVRVQKGMAKENFWVGPKSMSYYAKGYYRYGYIYEPQGNYLINLIVENDDFYETEAAGTVNRALSNIHDHVDYIDNIGVVNAKRLKRYREERKKDTGEDPLVLYGNIENTGFTRIDYDVDEIMQSGDAFIKPLGGGGQKLVLKKLNEKELLVVVINHHPTKLFLKSLFVALALLAFLAGIVIVGVNYWTIRRYGSLLKVEKERFRLAESFRRTINQMPSMIYHCRLSKNGEILLSYNDGKIFDKSQVILSETEMRPMKEVYSKMFMDVASDHLMKAFQNERIRFEASCEDRVFDNIVSPVDEAGIDETTGYMKEIIGFGNEISEWVNREKSASFLATHDALTGLPNRRAFKTRLQDALEKNKFPIVIYFDLNDFKVVNDEYGHGVGDEVLKVVAERMELFSSDQFCVSRFGGDEFVALATDLSFEEVNSLKERITQSVEEPIRAKKTYFQVKVSSGLSVYPEHGKTVEELIDTADRIMYAQKNKENRD